MKVVDGIEAGQSQGVGRCRCIYRVRGDTLMTPNHIAVQVCTSGYGRAGIGQSSWKGPNTGRQVELTLSLTCRDGCNSSFK